MMNFLQILLIHRKSAELHTKQECSKGAISRGKVCLLVGKNNGRMKGLIKLAMKPSINYMLNTSSAN